MTKRAVSIYMSISAACCIVAPGRFAVGLVLAVEEVFLVLLCAIFSTLLQKLRIDEIKESCLCIFIVCVVVLYRQLITLAFGALSLQLGFIFFIPAISNFSTAFLISDSGNTLLKRLQNTVPVHLVFCLYIMLFCLIRDIIGFGTFTLPSFDGIKTFIILNTTKLGFGCILATIPGAMLLCAIMLTLFLTAERQYFVITSAKAAKR